MAATKTAVAITVNRSELSRKLEFVGFAAEGKNTIPILAMVRVVVTKNKLTLATTNLDVSASASLMVESEAEASICVDAKRLAAFVKKLNDAEITLRFQDSALTVSGAKSKMSFNGRPIDDFPELQILEGDSIALPSAGLSALLKATYWAASKEESRFSLRAVKMDMTANNVRCAALDGMQLAIADVEMATQAEASCLIPADSVSAILGLLAESKNEVFVTVTEKIIQFETGVYMITSRLSSGAFPNIELIERAKFEPVGAVEKSAFVEAVGRLLLATTETTKGCRSVELKSSNGELEMDAEAADLGSGVEKLAIEGSTDWAVEMNGVHLLAGMGHCDGDRVEIARAGQFRLSSTWAIGDSHKLAYQYINAPMKPKKESN